MIKTLVTKIAIFAFFLLFLNSFANAQIIVAIKNGTAHRYDAKTGTYKGTVGAAGAIAASSDGETIAVVTKGGHVKRYAANGAYKGQVGSGKATGVQVAGGLIIVTYENGSVRKYDARTGAYKGAL